MWKAAARVTALPIKEEPKMAKEATK